MAENAPPASSAPANVAGTTTTSTATATATTTATTTGGTSSGTTAATTTTTDQNQNRGLPYYEKLRRDLRDSLQKKRMMDKSMVSATVAITAQTRASNLDVLFVNCSLCWTKPTFSNAPEISICKCLLADDLAHPTCYRPN